MTRLGMVIISIACLSLLDVKARECAIACRLGGWDSGAYQSKGDTCWCMDAKPYAAMTQKKGILPHQVRLPLSPYEPDKGSSEKPIKLWFDAKSLDE